MDHVNIPSIDSPRILRNVLVCEHRLVTWETGMRGVNMHHMLGYAFYLPGESAPLFVGEDYGVSRFDSIDDDKSLVGLLAFLTLKPGDTDAEYFASYSHEQMAFAESCEMSDLVAVIYDLQSTDCEESATFWEDSEAFYVHSGERVFADAEV